ncbi:hypothetical protein ACN262_25395 [Burkholderia gladioli]|uniref:hypothetical protein n=1 Tax=Burkholderia gladioli TaxID=28095 RepID=UPI003AFA7607
MSITVYTNQPQELLDDIKKEIDSKNIVTWAYDDDGDFYHTPDQWGGRAWLRASVQSGILVFSILGQKDAVMMKDVYGVYHGRFIEMLLTHFDDSFSNATATAHASANDLYKTVD